MKSFMSHMAGVAKTRRPSILSVVMLGVISPLALADGETWSLDSTTSSARFFQGSTADADSVNRGVARVSGRVKLDANDLGKSDFDFSIYPANEQWGQALSPEGALAAGFVPDTTDHTLLTFHSKRVRRMGNGKLEVTGDLTVTRVERSVTLTPSEGFAGPVYGDPVIHRETREIEFLFPSLSAAVSSDLLTSVALQKNGKEFFDLAGTARLGHEDFVELLSAIQDSNWPSVVQNERCDMPSGVGEDYHGATCTGRVIAATHPDNCEMPAVVGGEGYSGAVCTPASGNQTTIELDLKMHRMNSGRVSEMPLGSGATR